MGVVIRIWVWLKCIGVVGGCCVKRYIDFLILLIPTPLVFALFCSNIPTSLFIFKMFIFLVYIIFVQYSKCCSNNI